MKEILFFFLICLFTFQSYSQKANLSASNILNKSDFEFLLKLTNTIIDSSRIYPGQSVVSYFGPNSTGGTLIKPGGRGSYPSFWIRDYAMSLESGMVSPEEQRHMLILTASTQSDKTWITKNGSIVPYGSIPDHIRIDDGLPIYFPGTYDYIEQGNKVFGVYPPYGDQYFFIHMAYTYLQTSPELSFLLNEVNGTKLVDRLEIAFNVPPSRTNSELVYTNDDLRGIDFGFRDVITITGDLCYPSILKFQASNQLAEIFGILKNKSKSDKYKNIALQIKDALPEIFMDESGFLRASTQKGSQRDVWSTSLAIYLKALDEEYSIKSSQALSDSYKKGTLAYKGNIRHIPTTDDYSDSTAWEYSLAKKNSYQNGAYWGTPTGWVCYAIAQIDLPSAQKLAKEYIDDLRANDFRKGNKFGAPYECFHPSGPPKNPLYMTTVSCPYAVFLSMMNQ